MCPPPCGPRRSSGRSCKSKSEPKYAAVFTIGFLKTIAQSETLTGLIDRLWRDQDLSCLSRQAQVMGDENDAKSAKKLDRFLEKYYEGSLKVKDIKDLHLEFSIGSLNCIDFASGEDEVLELMERHAPKPAAPARKHSSSDNDALQHVREHLGRPDIATFEEAALALQQAFESDDPAYDEIKNCPLCQCFLGTCYWLPKGLKFDYEKAYTLYEKAAKSGLAKAQTNLAIVLRSNAIGKRHLRAARYWYEKAAAQGDIVAPKHIEEMGDDLPTVLKNQVHGDHNDAVISLPMTEFIPDAIQNSKLDSVASDVHCFLEDEESDPVRTNVALLEKTDGPISAQALIVDHGDRKTLGSVFPVANEGVELELKIDRILEWDNGYEATIEASTENRTFSFFMSNYFAHKHHMLPGDTYTFRLAAFAYNAEEQAQKGFQFEGQKAIDFLTKVGKEPDYDAEGNVEPVKFDLTHLVAFNQWRKEYPDDVEFVSPVKAVTEFNAWGGDLYKITIGVDPEEGLDIPLYVKKSVIKCTPEEGKSIHGVGWLHGTLIEKDMQEYILLRRGKKFPISGGKGTSMEDAIVVNSDRNDEAVSIEYAVLREYYAIKGKAYRLGTQFLLSDDQGRSFDQLDVTILGPDNTETTESWYFDITQGLGNL